MSSGTRSGAGDGGEPQGGTPPERPERIEIGYVARAHGVRGELRVVPHDPESDSLLGASRAWFAGVERQIVSARPTTGAILVVCEGVTDRDAAEALRGATVELHRDDVPLAEGEFFLADLVGLSVTDTAGAPLGRVVAVVPGPQDLLVLHDEQHERLLPAVPELLVEIDLDGGRLVVDAPEGLPADPLPSSSSPSPARPGPSPSGPAGRRRRER